MPPEDKKRDEYRLQGHEPRSIIDRYITRSLQRELRQNS